MRKVSNGSMGQHTFALTPQSRLPRSSFDRSRGMKTAFSEGYLIPFFVDEVLPGDTYNVASTIFARFSTLLFPIMDNIYLETHWFFVPNRLVWSHWENFCGAQDNPSDTTAYNVPQVVSPVGGFLVGSMADYFGLPINLAGLSVNALPFRGMNLIYNEWYRDENLQNSLVVNTGDGPDVYTNYTLQRRGKRHDYFTSCLPWPQKINDGTTVTLPLGTTAPVIRNESAMPNSATPTFAYHNGAVVNTNLVFTTTGAVVSGGANPVANTGLAWGQGGTGLLANLAGASSASINQFRQAIQLQALYERDARAGTRYFEVLKGHC